MNPLPPAAELQKLKLTRGWSNYQLADHFGVHEKTVRRRLNQRRPDDLEALPSFVRVPVRILVIDIETSPFLSWNWGRYKQFVAMNQVVREPEIICFAAKWLGEEEMIFHSKRGRGARKREMIKAAHELINEADIVLSYNGKRFDIPHLNREFEEQRLGPPRPYKHIDLFQTVRRQFRLPSNKLDDVSEWCGQGRKLQHGGMELWTGCLAGEDESWQTMQLYNEHDVRLLEQDYLRLRPWIISHPNLAAFTGTNVCPYCGSSHLRDDGFYTASTRRYILHQCEDCGGWTKDTHRYDRTDVAPVTA